MSESGSTGPTSWSTEAVSEPASNDLPGPGPRELEIVNMLRMYERRRHRALEDGRSEQVTPAEESLREVLRALVHRKP